MKTTYLNDLLDAPYPFMSRQRLPFSSSIITSMSLCLRGSAGDGRVWLKHLSITEFVVYGVLYLGEYPLCEFTVDTGTGGTIAQLVPLDMSVFQNIEDVAGFVVIGTVSATDGGTYDTALDIDPSCVNWTKADSGILGRYDIYSRYHPQIVVSEGLEEPAEFLNFEFSGLAKVADNAISVAASDIRGDFISLRSGIDPGYPEITSINGISTMDTITVTGAKLVFRIRDNGAPVRQVTYTMIQNDWADTLVLTGSSEFPNCYTGDTDDAITLPREVSNDNL